MKGQDHFCIETKRDVRHISNVGSERLIHSPVSLTLASIIVIISKRGNVWMNTCISHPEELEDNNANNLSGEERLRDEKTGTTEVTFWSPVSQSSWVRLYIRLRCPTLLKTYSLDYSTTTIRCNTSEIHIFLRLGTFTWTKFYLWYSSVKFQKIYASKLIPNSDTLQK